MWFIDEECKLIIIIPFVFRKRVGMLLLGPKLPRLYFESLT